MGNGVLLLLVPAALGLGWYSHMKKKHGTGPLVWRWLSGMPLDNYHRTNARWTKRSHGDKPVLHPTGHAVWFWHQARLLRATIRTGGTLGTAFAGWAWLFHRTALTLTALTLAAVFILYLAWRVYGLVYGWKHHLTWHRPLRRKLTRELAVRPPSLVVARDRSEVTIGLPGDFVGTDKQQEAVAHIVETTLAIEAPQPYWKLDHAKDKDGNRKPQVKFTRSEPPPALVKWADVTRYTDTAGPDELVVGIGKQGKIVTVSLKSDSPHFGISMGTGAGKSNLATFWLTQELRRGAIALILDAKLFSHPWAFKDMDAEYGQLPNVGYARRTSLLHDAMVWLGDELERRNQVAERIIDAKGNLHGDVGPRLWIVVEELNLATPLLKEHWGDPLVKQDWSDAHQGKDAPKKSPALTGMARVAFAGRAVKMHLIVIGQQLTAETLGGGAVRENIGVRCVARYQQSTWNMLVGRDVPMPPSPTVDGRVQCIAGPNVSETQTPLMDLEQVRELAIGGVVTPCPAGMPGIAVPDRAALPVGAPDLGMSYDSPPELPPGVTLSEAVREGIWRGNLAALQKASHRDGFPGPSGWRGNARVWDPADLYAFVARGRN